MGTRARIAVKHPVTGTFASIYTHWDGYPSHHGPILLQHYTTYDKVCALMALGSLSVLGASIGQKHDFDRRGDFDDCTAYGRDRGEEDTEAMTSDTLQELNALTQDCGGEYLYLFQDGAWYVAEGGIAFFGMPADKLPGDLKPLSDVVAAEAAQEE